MRKELENIEKFDSYLMGELSTEDKLAFEAKLIIDSKMAEDFTAYQELMDAYKRQVTSKAIAKAHTRYITLKWFRLIGLTLLISGILVFGYTLLNKNKAVNAQYKQVHKLNLAVDTNFIETTVDSNNLTTTNENNNEIQTPKVASVKLRKAPVNFGGLDMWSEPDVSHFTLSLDSTNIVQTEEGTLVLADKESFLLLNGEIATGKVEVSIAEFLHLDQMILGNLTTTSKGTALQTDGMIHIEAKQNGEKLHINPKKPLTISIPTNQTKANMLVFDGKVDTVKQTIDWVNPKEQNNYLVEIDLEQLDFLPPNFEQTLLENLPFMAVEDLSKQFIDSCYYRLSKLKEIDNFDWDSRYVIDENFEGWTNQFIMRKFNTSSSHNKDTLFYNANFRERFKYFFTRKYGSFRINKVDSNAYYEDYTNYLAKNYWQTNEILQNRMQKGGVNPKQVEEIKKDTYQGTWIATKEFEERLHLLQQEENGDSLLDTYCSNLHKNLHEVDDLVIPQMQNEKNKERLIVLQSKKPTQVKTDKNLIILSQYYTKQRKAYQEEMDKMNNEILAKKGRIAVRNNKRNIKLGKSKLSAKQINARKKQAYTFNWSGGSWINIDKYLHELSYGKKVQTAVRILDSLNPTVYQHIYMLNNLTRLNMDNSFHCYASYPDQKRESAKGAKDALVVSVSMQDEELYRLGIKRFDPYKTDSITVEYVVVNKLGLMRALKKLRGANNYIDHLVKDLENKRAKIIENQKLQRNRDSTTDKIGRANKFWKPLIVIVYLKSLAAKFTDEEENNTQTKRIKN